MDLSSYAVNRRKFLANTSALSVAACFGLPESAEQNLRQKRRP